MNRIEGFVEDLAYFAEQADIEVRSGVLEGGSAEVAYRDGVTAERVARDAAAAGAGAIYLATGENPEEGLPYAVASWTDGAVVHLAKVEIWDPAPLEDPGADADATFEVSTGFAGVTFEVSSQFRMAPPDSRYWDLPARLKRVADTIAADPRYEPLEKSREEVIAEHTVGLSSEDREYVEMAVPGRFETVYGADLNAEADRWARRLLEIEGAVDLVEPWSGLKEAIAEHLPEVGVQLRRRVHSRVCEIVRETGLKDEAEARIEQITVDLLESLPPAVRDRLGFMSRTAARLEVLSPYTQHLTPHDRRQLRWRASDLEVRQYKQRREARYATATSVLMHDQGMTRAAASRVLGVSSSVLARLLRENPDRVDLDPNDPLRDLHPALRDL